MKLGAFSISLAVKDLAQSKAFYEKLGFEPHGGIEEQGWLIMKNEDAAILNDAARRNGMHTLREDGWGKIAAGVTTVDEVMRVTQEF